MTNEDDEELTLPGVAELPTDPESRQATVMLALRKLSDATGCPEAIEQAYELGCRASEVAEQQLASSPLIRACDAIPDITLSKWACSIGGHWEPVRHALRAARFDQGLNLDAPHEEFDSDGWLRSRRQSLAPATRRKEATPP